MGRFGWNRCWSSCFCGPSGFGLRDRKHRVENWGAMKVYRRKTREVIRRFRARRLSFPGCISALDSALADLIPRLTGDQIAPLRALMLANNEIVMKEMERRGSVVSIESGIHGSQDEDSKWPAAMVRKRWRPWFAANVKCL